MKYKLIVLIICLILLSGCNATYNLSISEDKTSEETFITSDYINYYSKEDMLEILPSMINAFDDKYTFEGNNLVISRNKDNYKELNNDEEIDTYFGKLKIKSKKISFKPNYDTCIFTFSDGGEYVTDSKIKINVTLPFDVAKSNADAVNGNVYTWVYGIDDCKKEAYIRFKNPYIIVFIVIGVLIIGGIVLFISKMKKSGNL